MKKNINITIISKSIKYENHIWEISELRKCSDFDNEYRVTEDDFLVVNVSLCLL